MSTFKKDIGMKIALGGILAALSVVTIFLASFMPGADLSLFALSSLYIGLYIEKEGIRSGIVFYLATVGLSFIIVPAKLAILPYPFLFGIYPVLRSFLNKINNKIANIFVKLLTFNLLCLISWIIFKNLALGAIKLPDFPVFVIIIGAQFLFYLYDQILERLIKLLLTKIK